MLDSVFFLNIFTSIIDCAYIMKTSGEVYPTEESKNDAQIIKTKNESVCIYRRFTS